MSYKINNEDNLTFIFRNVAFIAVLLSLIAPLVISKDMFFPFIGPKSIYFMFFSQIAFFSWLVLAIHNRNFLPSKNIILFSLSLFIGVLFLNSFLGEDFQNSFWSNHERMTGFLMHLHLFGFFLAATSIFRNWEWKVVFSSSAFIASVLGIIAMYDRFVGIETVSFSGGATTGNTSFMGTYLLFNAFIALYLFLKNKDYYRILGGIFFAIISFSLIFNPGGRAALISFVSGIILFYLLFLLFEKKGFLRILSGIIILIAFLFSIAGFLIVLNPKSETAQSFLSKSNLGTIGGRTIVWEISLKGFLDKPIFGWGLENFPLAFSKHYNPCLGTERCGADTLYDRAHNFWHDNLVSFGIIGSVFYFFLFGSVLFFLWRKYFKKETGFIEAGIFTSLFAAYFVQGLTVFDVVSSLIMLFLILAFISGLSKKEEYSFEKVKDPSVIVIFLIFLLFLFYLNYFVIRPYKASTLIIESFRSEVGSERRIELAKEAIYISPLGRDHIRKQMASRIIAYTGKSSGALNEIIFFINELEDEILRSPFDYNSHISLGRLYLQYVNIFIAINERNVTEEILDEAMVYVGRAKEVLEKAIEISPKKQTAYWFLAEAKVKEGNPEEALLLTQKAIELEPGIMESHFYSIRIIKDVLKNRELAIEKVEEAKRINPNWDFSPLFNSNADY